MKTLAEQIACARRELAMRKTYYPARVEARRMTAEAAHREIDCMAAIIETLGVVGKTYAMLQDGAAFSGEYGSQARLDLLAELKGIIGQ